MPLYKVSLKSSGNSNTIAFEKGMSIQVNMPTTNNPVLSNGGKLVAEAFMRIYGLDVKKAGLLNGAYLQVEEMK
ncbi:DUF6140 family protein [Lentimicrobium sp. S6]|uniref:DUF6140 family protein n=1 Tax=Lentimicrobium sp. S6 TaxID=2735872 RepID=UPI0015517301|nr:DUF6140 family protein [Lentimicrobium sp. S6]NPD46902.1 hypothetical protein [Lentimicrobium sp. S6]